MKLFFYFWCSFSSPNEKLHQNLLKKTGFGGCIEGFFSIARVLLPLESSGFFKRKPVQNYPPVQNFRVLASFVREIFADKFFPPFLGADPRGLNL